MVAHGLGVFQRANTGFSMLLFYMNIFFGRTPFVFLYVATILFNYKWQGVNVISATITHLDVYTFAP